MYDSMFIHSSLVEHLGCFQFLVILNKTTINIHAKSLCGHKFKSVEQIPRSTTGGTYGKSMFLRNGKTVLQSGYGILHHSQQWMRELHQQCSYGQFSRFQPF